MKFDPNTWPELELSDIIRLNQLVRLSIDFDSFKHWYIELTVPAQCTLIGTLIEFAYQAGYDEHTYQEAVKEAGLSPTEPLVELAASPERMRQFLVAQRYRHGLEWLITLEATERFAVFTLFVYLFGKAERQCFQNENPETCNHWWHRDLLNEHIEASLLNDPYYYRTSRRDDRTLKA